jgi:hypothetical protein
VKDEHVYLWEAPPPTSTAPARGIEEHINLASGVLMRATPLTTLDVFIIPPCGPF